MLIDKSSYDVIKNEILEYGKKICTNEELESFSRHIDSKLNDFRPTLMIYGAYNAGKSTLLNALFGKEEYAKTGDAPETKEVHDYAYNGYTIYDTPGLNARPEDDIVTTKHLNKSEVVLFVISNNGSLEEEFVYNKISEVVKANKPIIIVLNNKSGIDLNSIEAIEVIEKVSYNLRQIGDRNSIDRIENKVEVCMVNAKSALKAKIENKNILLKKSNLPILEEKIEECLNNSGQKEVINTLNIYIKNFIDNLLTKIDNKIDNVQLKKIEELITYFEKLKQSSDIKLKNVIDKKMIAVTENISSMILNEGITENSLRTYIDEAICDINQQISQIINSINNNISTKIGEFSKEFEELVIKEISFDSSSNRINDLEESLISDDIKNKLKNVISDRRTLEEASKKILTLAKNHLPKNIMKGKGPVWMGKAAGKAAIGISVAIEAYNVYSAQKEHNEMIEKQRQMLMSARNNAQTISNSVKTSLYSMTDEIIDEIFNDLIISYRENSLKININNSEFLDIKDKFITILNRF